MGIKNLMPLIKKKAPRAISQRQITDFQGQSVASEVSLIMYQFLVSTQRVKGSSIVELKDSQGIPTGHLLGILNRTVLFLSNGIKPVWVLDGEPPLFKTEELDKRRQSKTKASEKAQDAIQLGDYAEALSQNKRSIFVTDEMENDVQTMLELLGIPVIQAPSEGEAQCAHLAKAGKVNATVTEDMDALTFQTPLLLRGFNSKKDPIQEINYNILLEDLQLDKDQFTDMCILCGCDYTSTIGNVGPVNALKLIQQHKNIENVIEYLQEQNKDPKKKKKFIIPDNFQYEQARNLFNNPQIKNHEEINLQWRKPDETSAKQFLIEQKGFSEKRVVAIINKLKKSTIYD